MSPSTLRCLFWVLLMMALPARAASYSFPGALPPGCSGSNGAYSCGALALAYTDTVTIASPKPAKITINGGLSVGDSATINSAGQAADLTLVVTGTLTLAYQSVIRAGITAGAIQNADGYATLSGSLTTGSGAISLGYLSTLNGDITSSTGAINLAQGVVISGNVISTSGAVSLGYQAQVSGAISTSGAVTLAQASIVSGAVNGGSGAVSLGYQTKVVGRITTSSGTITLDQAAIAQSCVKSTASATITLGYQASVNSVCCGASCGNSCVVNNSNAAMPPACQPPPTAEYRFDECSYSGAAGEAKDSSGGNHATAVLGAANSGTAPTVVNRYANLSYTDGRRYFTPGSAIPLTGNWTISAWVKFPLSTGGSPYHVLGAMAGGGDLLYLDGNNGMRWGVYTPGNIVPGTFKLNTLSGGWHHLAVVGQGSSTKLYVDGALKDSVNAKASGSLAYIGASYDVDAGTHEGMNSGLDEYLVFASALSASEIGSIYGNQAAGRNYDGSTRAVPACPTGPGSFSIAGTGSASTCSAQTLTITARDAGGNTLSNYTGTVTLSTSSGRGDWSAGSSPAPAGTLTPGASNSGLASYQFVAGDGGVVKLRLSHTLAQDVTVTVVDATAAGSSSTSAAIEYRDNAFVFAEDLGNRVSGSDIAVAGRPHDHTLSYIRRDPSTGSCGVASDYAGSKALKVWRSDSAGSWVAPTVVSPALSIPPTQPAGNNLNLTFTNGVASFNLGTTDIGRYSLNARDDSLTSAANAITGGGSILTVRPFTVLVSAIKYGSTNNPNGSAAGDAMFAPAGAGFSATIAAYRWDAAMLSNGADPGSTGTPAVNASEAAMKVGGRTNGFASAVTLSPLAASQTPAGGSLGSLNNGSIAGTSFASGTVTVSTLQYTEVGSFALNTSGLVSNFLGSGLALNAVVVNAGGAQNTRVGRFVPAGFALSAATVGHRNNASCSPASTFSYLDENFKLQFTLTAKNALGGTTTNYTGAYALLDLSAPAGFGLAGIQGSTAFKTDNNRLSLVSSSGNWASGVAANVQLIAAAKRTAAADGPFETAKFGIAATDSDGVAMSGLDLDTDSPANGNDRVLLATVPLRFGRLQLMNAIGAQNRDLAMPVLAQYWNGIGFVDNTLDSCSRISSTHVNFGNYRKTLTSADSNLQTSPVTVSAGRAKLVLSKPGAGRSGSFDVGLSLSGSATASTCMASFNPVAGDVATTGAGMGYLRGAWCGSAFDKDPSARATFGLYRGADNLLYQRENY